MEEKRAFLSVKLSVIKLPNVEHLPPFSLAAWVHTAAAAKDRTQEADGSGPEAGSATSPHTALGK